MNIVVFNNSIIDEKGMSGSDNRALNWSQIWSNDYDILLVIPNAGKTRYKNINIKQKIITTTNDFTASTHFKIFIEYIKRSFQTIKKVNFLKSSKNILYASSDLLPDSIPAIFLKVFNKKQSKLVMGCHLVAPNPFKGYDNKIKIPSLSNLYYFITQNFILLLAKYYVDLLLVSNSFDKDKIVTGFNFDKNKILITYGGVYFKDIDSLDTQDKIYDAIFVGRAHPQKGIPDLIDSWRIITKSNSDAVLAIVGVRETFLYLEKVIREYKIEKNIIFLGYLDGVEKYKAIKSSKLLICPSYYESFGMVILEGIACEVPVVAYSLDIYKDIYKDNIISVEIGNINNLSNCILNSLDLYQNKQYLERTSTYAREFSFEKTAQKILEKIEG